MAQAHRLLEVHPVAQEPTVAIQQHLVLLPLAVVVAAAEMLQVQLTVKLVAVAVAGQDTVTQD